jgi:hypothetical protein
LLRRSEERKIATQRHIVAVNVVTGDDGLIGYEIQKHVNCVVTWATTIWKAGIARCGKSLAETYTRVWHGQVRAQVITVRYGDVGEDADVG